MQRRLLIRIGLVCAVLATATTSATAASEQRSDIPACEELVTVHQAQLALGEPHAFILNRQVVGTTRSCDYAGGSKGAIGHSFDVQWGPYTEYLKQIPAFTKGPVCSVRKDVCAKLAAVVKLRPDLKSFAGLQKALGQAGATKAVQGPEFDNNPAFVWLPSKGLTPLDQMAWVFVYVVKSAHIIQVGCTDNAATAADTRCGLAAAGWAYNNVT